MLDWYTIPLLFGTWHALLFAGLLGNQSRRRDSLADAVLAGLLLALGLLLLPVLLGMLGVGWFWREALFFPRDPSLLLGPLIWWYVRALTDDRFRLSRKQAWHVLPFAVLVIYQLAVFMQGQDAVHRWMDRVHLPWVQTLVEAAVLVSSLAYLFVATRHFWRYRRWLEKEYADPASRRYGWVAVFLLVAAGAIAANSLFHVLEWVGVDLDFTQNWFRYLAFTAIAYFLGVAGLQRRPALVAFRPEGENGTKIIHTPVTSAEADPWPERIQALLETEALYRDPDFTVTEMARRLGTNRSVVSQSINQGLGMNFNQLVNRYRVRAFQGAVLRPENEGYSLLGVAMHCGFNSKATFNRAFRQETGMSPSEYVRTQRMVDTGA
jgi:AraC-like DNA-binding protein